jgi:hypothetical protein
MKYIKKFEINEKVILSNNFPKKFAINVKDSTDSEKREIISQFEKYFEIDNDIKKEMTDSGRYETPWAWVFSIYNYSLKPYLDISFVSTPHWGAGYDYMEDIITAKEFLEIGFDGIKSLILKKKEERIFKQNINKFNL